MTAEQDGAACTTCRWRAGETSHSEIAQSAMSQGASIARVAMGETNEAAAQHRLGAPEPTGATAAMHRRQTARSAYGR